MNTSGSPWTIVLCSLVILVLMLMTIQRNATLSTEELLWKDTVSKSPQKARPHINLGKWYASVGNYKRAFEEYQTAEDLANADHSVMGRDQLLIAQSDLASMFIHLQEWVLAENLLRATLSLQPDFGPAIVNLSNVLIVQKRQTEAVTVIDRALVGRSLGPSEGKLYQNKGIALCELGLVEPANQNFTIAAKVDADLERLECGAGVPH